MPFRAFVGDSVTDLPAMLNTEVGILMGESSSVLSMCSTLGVPVSPLADLNSHIRQGNRAALISLDTSLRIYRAESWADITDLIELTAGEVS